MVRLARTPSRGHEGGHRPLRILLARLVLSATAMATPLQLPRRHSAPSGSASPTLRETGASTPFSRIIDARKSSVQDARRKSAGASSPSCTNTRSPRTTSMASTSFHAPSRLTQASSVTQRAYARIDGSDVRQGRRQHTIAGQSQGFVGLFGPSLAKRSRAAAQERPSVVCISISSTSSSPWIAELVICLHAVSEAFLQPCVIRARATAACCDWPPGLCESTGSLRLKAMAKSCQRCAASLSTGAARSRSAQASRAVLQKPRLGTKNQAGVSGFSEFLHWRPEAPRLVAWSPSTPMGPPKPS